MNFAFCFILLTEYKDRTDSSHLPGHCFCPGHAINVNVPLVPVAAANVLMLCAGMPLQPHQHHNTVCRLSCQIYQQAACLNNPMKKSGGITAKP